MDPATILKVEAPRKKEELSWKEADNGHLAEKIHGGDTMCDEHARNDESAPSTAKTRLTLRTLDEIPKHLQFNPHIRTGYRPPMTVRECIASIFSFHNETINILTHGFAIIYILATVPNLLPWGTQGALTGILSWCHLIGAVSPWVGSFIYHVFMNVNYDERIYRSLLKLDMLGIWLCQSFGAIPMIAASVHCLSNPLWHCCIWLYCFLSIWGLLKAMNAKSPWERRMCFLPPFMMRIFVMILRYNNIGGGNPEAWTHIILPDIVSVVGGMIGAMRIPEKWIPGQVDLMLNSHNIMHVMVVLAVCSMHVATLQDLAWIADPSVCISGNDSPHSHEEL